MNANTAWKPERLRALSDEQLVNHFKRAACEGNEYDNRAETESLRAELLARLAAARAAAQGSR